ncbi:Zinc finger, BED-type [Phytophthora cactorum]|nr:Zinc finger, BED-type [Phytophthora cactorum]
MEYQQSAAGERVPASAFDPSTPKTPENMFRIKRAHRPEMWDFIRLVRKEEFAHVPKYDLISDNAKGAHCLKCGTDISYTKGTTTYVKKHLATRHPGQLSTTRQSHSPRASSGLPSSRPTHWTSQPMSSQSPVAGERVYEAVSDPTIPRTPENMFRMKGAHKPEMWDFIRLVRKDELAHVPKDNLISDNAVGAHCLKCGMNIPSPESAFKSCITITKPSLDHVFAPDTCDASPDDATECCDDECVSEPVSDSPTPRTPENMFKMKGAHKPELWDFIRLVRKDKFACVPKDDLISDNAKGAHCLKCGTDIPYNKGLTNYVKSHVATRHSGHLEAAQQRKGKRNAGVSLATPRRPSTISSSDRPEVMPEVIEINLSSGRPELKEIAPELQVHANKLLAMWLAQTRRPFSTVEDFNLVAYVKHVSEAFGGVKMKLPSQVQLHAIVMDIADQAPTATQEHINHSVHQEHKA